MNVLVIASGGFDSTVLLYKLMSDGHYVSAVGFDYGQRHRRELDYLDYHCRRLDVALKVIDITSIAQAFGETALTGAGGPDVPVGHYAVTDNSSTVVPNRNMVLLSLATSMAVTGGFDAVAYGAHHSNPATYADTRADFADAMAKAIALCDFSEIKLLRPFADMSKSDIAALAGRLDVNPASTYSCYQGAALHCGICGTCTKRREAFALAGLVDTTLYEYDTASLDEYP